MTTARALVLSVLIGFSSGKSLAAGSYSGLVKSEWSPDGRTMTLLEDFAYTDPVGRKWLTPKGHAVDGASIPQIAWTIIGGPLEGKYRDSSVIHDVGCDKRWAPWQIVHEVFYMGMRTSGVEEWRAKIMYAAVYHFGPRWPEVVKVSGIPAVQTPVARENALQVAKAEPGSTAEIVSVFPSTNTPSQSTSTFTVRINPPPLRLTEEQFGILRREIEAAAAAGRPTPSLSVIRSAGVVRR
jgi:hypothetical protein